MKNKPLSMRSVISIMDAPFGHEKLRQVHTYKYTD